MDDEDVGSGVERDARRAAKIHAGRQLERLGNRDIGKWWSYHLHDTRISHPANRDLAAPSLLQADAATDLSSPSDNTITALPIIGSIASIDLAGPVSHCAKTLISQAFSIRFHLSRPR
jgi:hypothetical protein